MIAPHGGCHGQTPSSESDHADNRDPSIPKNDLLLKAARGLRTPRTPVWLMRQAGRFDPAYQKIRQDCGLELEDLFRDPELAAEITMLPVRLGVDAAILFQDILTPLSPLGAHFVFRPGPVLDQPIRTTAQIEQLKLYDPGLEMPFIAESIELTLEKLQGSIPLLGFAGAPLTLAAFLIEGASPGDAPNVKALMRDDPEACHLLLDKLTNMTIDYLQLQIESGVHAFQLFESVGDLFDDAQYAKFAQPCQKRIMQVLSDSNSGGGGGSVPRILFVKENPRVDLMVGTGADVLSVGKCINLREAKEVLGESFALQGNVDNAILRDGTFEQIEAAVTDCIAAGDHQGHILNLNHGIFKDTPFDNVTHFIDVARNTRLHEREPLTIEGT